MSVRYSAMRLQSSGTPGLSVRLNLAAARTGPLKRRRVDGGIDETEVIMKNRRRWIALSLACLTLAASGSLARAAYDELKEPHLWIKDYSKADYKALDAVLNRKDCKFLGGAELNASSSLRYGGDTTALNKFIAALSLCPRVIVHVNFYRPGPGAVESDWHVTQMAPSPELVVRINLASEKVSVEKLYLPPVKAEKAPD